MLRHLKYLYMIFNATTFKSFGEGMKGKHQLFVACFLILAVFLVPVGAYCEPLPDLSLDISEEAPPGYGYLLIITSPLAGYGTIEGIVYNLLPLGVEFPVNDRTGLALRPTLYYYKDDFQYLQLLARLAVYSRARTGERPYGGWFAGALLAGGYQLQEGWAGAGGAPTAGYAWQGESPWRFMAGLWYTPVPRRSGGMVLELGRWF